MKWLSALAFAAATLAAGAAHADHRAGHRYDDTYAEEYGDYDEGWYWPSYEEPRFEDDGFDRYEPRHPPRKKHRHEGDRDHGDRQKPNRNSRFDHGYRLDKDN